MHYFKICEIYKLNKGGIFFSNEHFIKGKKNVTMDKCLCYSLIFLDLNCYKLINFLIIINSI